MSSPIPFVPFSRHRDLSVYYNGRLPHWRQEGCTYFVTFRTSDSIPATRFHELKSDLKSRLEECNSGDPSETTDWYQRRIEKELDRGLGACPLKKSELAEVVANAIRHFDGEKLRLGDFVVMPNHVHSLIQPLGQNRLEAILASIKRFSGRVINEHLRTQGSFWQRDSYDRIVRDAEELIRLQQYIATNPTKAGLKKGEFIYQAGRFSVQ